MSLKYEVLPEKDAKKIIFFGSFDETIKLTLDSLWQVPSDNLIFSFKYVENINSLGIRNWILFVSKFSDERQLVFDECPFHLVSVMNMHPGFRGKSQVRSFFGEFVCEGCNEDSSILFESAEGFEGIRKRIDNARCDKCAAKLVLSEFEDAFLDFLKQ